VLLQSLVIRKPCYISVISLLISNMVSYSKNISGSWCTVRYYQLTKEGLNTMDHCYTFFIFLDLIHLLTSFCFKYLPNTKHFSVFWLLMALYVGTNKQKLLCFELLALIAQQSLLSFCPLKSVVSVDGAHLDFLLGILLTFLYTSINLVYLSIIPQ